MIRLVSIVLCFVFHCFMFTLGAEERSVGEWVKERDEKKVVVYTRSVEGSSLKEFKAETILDANVETVLKVMLDFPSYPEWMHNYESCKVVKKLGDLRFLFYAEIFAPWPVRNRDVVIEFLVEKNEVGNGYLLKMNNRNGEVAENSDFVRLPLYAGIWKIYVNAEGKTVLFTQTHAEPGGAIPTWLANSIMTDGPVVTLSNMHEMVKKQKYQ